MLVLFWCLGRWSRIVIIDNHNILLRDRVPDSDLIVDQLSGNPLLGYPVHIWGAGIDVVVSSGSDTRHNTIYGNQAAWEQFFNNKPQSMEIRVQLHDPYGESHLPISEEIVIELPGYCGAALAYVVFTQNH